MRVSELYLQCLIDIWLVKAAQQSHKVNLDIGILTTHAGDQVGNHFRSNRFFNDLE